MSCEYLLMKNDPECVSPVIISPDAHSVSELKNDLRETTRAEGKLVSETIQNGMFS